MIRGFAVGQSYASLSNRPARPKKASAAQELSSDKANTPAPPIHIATVTSIIVLTACLIEIRQERPNLEHDPRFERLTRYAREVGG
jgi:hypothetical protein